MSEIISPEINEVSEALIDYYLQPGFPELMRGDPPGTKEGLRGDENERTITLLT